MTAVRTRAACRRAGAGLLLLVAALAASLASGGPAGAHGDTAELAVEASDPAGELTVHLEVSARFTNDDDLVEDATVSVTGVGPGGATLGPTPLEPLPDTVGLYGADVSFPAAGAWDLSVSSTEPEGSVTATVEVPEPTTTTAADTSTTSASTGAGEQAGADEDGEDGAASSPLPWIVLGLAVGVGLGVGFVLWRRAAAATAAGAGDATGAGGPGPDGPATGTG